MTPSPPPQPSISDDRVLDEAARWFVKAQAGLSSWERASLLAWLNAAPEHAVAMDLVTIAWADSTEVARSAALRPELLRARSFQLAGATHLRPRRAILVTAGGAITAVACMVLAVFTWREASTDVTYRTPRGDALTVTLSDGSRLQLDSGTTIHVHIDPLSRSARLEGGEAEFDIAHEAVRPFHVAVRGIEIRDLGTRFTIRDRAGLVRVVLIEGKAEVLDPTNDGHGDAVLSPGQQALADQSGIEVSTANLSTALAWRDGRIVLADVSLSEALEEWRSRAQADFVLANPSLGRLRISGVYRTVDVVAFLNALSRVHLISWREIARDRYELRAASAAPQP
jgi:transmembrane sensor